MGSGDEGGMKMEGLTTVNDPDLAPDEAYQIVEVKELNVEETMASVEPVNGEDGDDEVKAVTEEEVKYEDVKDGDFLEKKRSPLVGEALRRNCLYLYGVDVISTDEILSMFQMYGAKKVQWINDSSCNIIFEDEAPLKSILGYDEDTPEHEVAPMEDPLKEIREFTKSTKRIHLYGRMATEGDRRPEKPSKYSAWSRTIQATGDLRSKLNRVRAGLEQPDQPEDLRAVLKRERLAKGGRQTKTTQRPRVVIETDRYRLNKFDKSKVIKK